MDTNLQGLIAQYQSRVREAVALMYRSGVRMPHSGVAWSRDDIPGKGVLNGGIEYFKHGAGCEVRLETGPVEFDFGDSGEIDGVDPWWLTKFAKHRLPCFNFEHVGQIQYCFDVAVVHGDLEQSRSGLYYLRGVHRAYASEIDATLPGDRLPTHHHDMVMTLYAHYFETADLMREKFEKLDTKLRKQGKLSRKEEVESRIYFLTWLGFLWSTCEGFTHKIKMRQLLSAHRPHDFQELLPKSYALGKLIAAHFDPLREVRNSVFHLRDNPEKIRRFLSKEKDRLSWALELHDAFKDFFSSYRLHCLLHYFDNNRRAEIDIEIGRSRRTFKA
jgi:hypothetical protein